MNALAGKIAIVTGASSGIGRATALLFAREGASVVVSARRSRELDALVSEIALQGGRAVAVAGDLRDEAVAQRLTATALEHFGGLDVAFNNAGIIGELGAVHMISPAGWRETLDVNLTAAFLAARYQVPAMLERGSGSIIFTSTFVGHTVGYPGAAAYAASKAGMIGLAQVLAAELGPRGIRVNTLLPGGTDTPAARAMNPAPEAWAAVERMHALKRIARPEEQARVALFLASDASSFVTGSALLADGGVSIYRG